MHVAFQTLNFDVLEKSSIFLFLEIEQYATIRDGHESLIISCPFSRKSPHLSPFMTHGIAVQKHLYKRKTFPKSE